MENKITCRVTGRYALFTDPVTKIGGEKNTLMIPTYEALKGICSSIYWKPLIIWYVDKVCIVKAIRTESKGIRPIKYGGGNDLAYYTYLSDVEYIVTAHFEFNRNRMDLQSDFNENKHYFIAKRSLERGGRRDIFLGTRECQGYVEPCEFSYLESCYAQTPLLDFGLQFHSFVYPDEGNKQDLVAKLWNPQMINGVIEFMRPTECPKERVIRQMEVKKFESSNMKLVDEEMETKGYEIGGDRV